MAGQLARIHSKATVSKGSDQCTNPIKTPNNCVTVELTIMFDKYGLGLQPWSSCWSNDNLKICFRGRAERMCTDDGTSSSLHCWGKVCFSCEMKTTILSNWCKRHFTSSQVKETEDPGFLLHILLSNVCTRWAFHLIHLYILCHSATLCELNGLEKKVCENCSPLNSTACHVFFCCVPRVAQMW